MTTTLTPELAEDLTSLDYALDSLSGSDAYSQILDELIELLEYRVALHEELTEE